MFNFLQKGIRGNKKKRSFEFHGYNLALRRITWIEFIRESLYDASDTNCFIDI